MLLKKTKRVRRKRIELLDSKSKKVNKTSILSQNWLTIYIKTEKKKDCKFNSEQIAIAMLNRQTTFEHQASLRFEMQ